MAVLIILIIETIYAMAMTALHMKQDELIEDLLKINAIQTKRIKMQKQEIKRLHDQVENEDENAMAWKREKERLLAINDKLMERLKRTIPG